MQFTEIFIVVEKRVISSEYRLSSTLQMQIYGSIFFRIVVAAHISSGVFIIPLFVLALRMDGIWKNTDALALIMKKYGKQIRMIHCRNFFLDGYELDFASSYQFLFYTHHTCHVSISSDCNYRFILFTRFS